MSSNQDCRSLPQYRIDLSYFGTRFSGWQSQPNGNTIQDHLEQALATILRTPTRVTGSSRTDAGVHASMQVAAFRHESADLDGWRLTRGLNALLDCDIRVHQVGAVEKTFHPVLSAEAKVYRYRIWRREGWHAHQAATCWKVRGNLEVAAMREAAAALRGEHDFSSFCAADSSAKSKIRHIHALEIFDLGPILEILVIGNGFLKQMVRAIVGTLVEVGNGRRRADSMSTILAASDRRVAGPSAAACGLTLNYVSYSGVPPLDNFTPRVETWMAGQFAP